MAWEAITKEEVAEFIKVPQASLRDEWYNQSVALIENRAGIHGIGNITTRTDYLDGDGGKFIAVRYPPISSVTSVSINDYVISSSLYRADERYIVLIEKFSINPYFIDAVFPEGIRNVKVVYESGASSNPLVSLAIMLLVKEFSNIATSEGSAARVQFFQTDRQDGVERVRRSSGFEARLQSIIRSVFPVNFRVR